MKFALALFAALIATPAAAQSPVKPTALLFNGLAQYQPGILTPLAALASDLGYMLDARTRSGTWGALVVSSEDVIGYSKRPAVPDRSRERVIGRCGRAFGARPPEKAYAIEILIAETRPRK